MLAPIVLFVFNRPWHTKQTVNALKNNELASESDLFIFADGPKENSTIDQINAVNNVRSFIKGITGFKSINIDISSNNKGLANSVIYGVSKVIEKYGKVIVVEDDIVTHPFFLRFMNDALSFYAEDNRIFSIGACMENIKIPPEYDKDIFICKRVESWGWGTWNSRWKIAEWNNDNYSIFKDTTKKEIQKLCIGGDDLWSMLQNQYKGIIDSWAIRWQYNLCINDKFCLRPIYSFVRNIGMDGSGTHYNQSTFNDNQRPLESNIVINDYKFLPFYSYGNYNIKLTTSINANRKINREIKHFFAVKKNNLTNKIFFKIKNIITKLLKNNFIQ